MNEPWDGRERRRGNPSAQAEEAFRLATQAMQSISTHEQVCGERWKAAHQAMMRVEKGVDGLYRRWWQVLVGLVGGVAALAGASIMQAIHFG